MDLIFFRLSKLAWLVVSPDFLLVLLVLTGVTLLFSGAVKKAKIVLSTAALCLVAVSVLPLGQMLMAPLENRFPIPISLPDRVDGIIQLGGAEKPYLSHVRGQAQLGAAADRYLTAIRLMSQYPGAVLLFTGGSGSLKHPRQKDADVARLAFTALGADMSRIVFESESRNTYENVTASKAKVKPRPGQNWILVTTASHMPRAFGVFIRQGWTVIPYPVDFRTRPGIRWFDLNPDFGNNLRLLKRGAREWLGLFAYYFSGKTPALLPGKS